MQTNYHWLDTLPQEYLDNKKDLDFLIRLNKNKTVAVTQTALLREAGEHCGKQDMVNF